MTDRITDQRLAEYVKAAEMTPRYMRGVVESLVKWLQAERKWVDHVTKNWSRDREDWEQRIAELEAHIVAADKHQTAEEPGDLLFNEVTGLHAEDDLYQIDELQRKHEALVDNIMEYLDVDAVEWATESGDPPADIVYFANRIRALLEDDDER